MALFKPNLNCTITPHTGYDTYGQVVKGISTSERCAIITLMEAEDKSAVRADSSASRGASRETFTTAKILLTAVTVARLDDVIEIAGLILKITSKFPRHNLQGVLDHHEITAVTWKKA